jgi:tetratricopeptide (TPR) repeat protein
MILAGSLALLVWGQAAPNWKDQGESDIGLAAGAEKDPVKQLELLKKWEQQYPDSALANQRTLMQAQALLSVTTSAYGKTDAATLDAGQKAGQQLLDKFESFFAPGVKPATLSDAQWASAKSASLLQIHSVMAYIAQAKKDDATAEAEYKKVLGLDPNQASASYQLGATIIREMIASKDTTRYSEAIYDFARSIAVTGPTALPAAGKDAAQKALNKYYPGYHGSSDGLPDLMKQVASAALPPAGFHIQSIVEIEEAKAKDHAAWAAQHPDLDFWENIKAALTSQGDAYFASLKDVGFPPPAGDAYKGPAMFKGKVISQPGTKEILVSVDNVPTGDAILKFEDNIKGTIPPDTELQFKGVVDSYTKDPSYVLTLNIQEPKTDVVGLPDDIKFVPDAAAKPKPAGRGKAATKSTRKAQ